MWVEVAGGKRRASLLGIVFLPLYQQKPVITGSQSQTGRVMAPIAFTRIDVCEIFSPHKLLGGFYKAPWSQCMFDLAC